MTSEVQDDSGEALRAAAAGLDADLGPRAIADAIDSMAASMPEPGQIVGDFRLGRVIGRGGMGVVFVAEQLSVPGRQVAVKLLHGAGSSSVARQRFAREVEVIGRLDHPHIVPILWSDMHAMVPYFAMKLVDGRLLRELVRGGALRGDWRAIATLVRDLALALAHAHARGVVHRDVKPGNVIVDREGRAMLLDFGLAGFAEGSDLTLSTDSLGTLDYMAPEQLDHTHGDIGPRTDVYGLGVAMFECLCGRTPFAGSTRQATVAQILRGGGGSVREVAPETPGDLATICVKAMQTRPVDRYADAAAMAADLEAFLAHRPIAAHAPGWFDRSWLWTRRHRSVAVTGGIGALVAVTLVTYFTWLRPAWAVAERLATAAVLAQDHDETVAAASTLHAELRALRARTPDIVVDRGFDAKKRRLRELRAQAERLAAERESLIEQCLSLAPEHRQARALQADMLAERLRQMLAGAGVVQRRLAIAAAQERLQRLDDSGRHAALLDNTAMLNVTCPTGSAEVVLCAAVETSDGRSQWTSPDDPGSIVLGPTPCVARITEGSWRLHATMPSCATIDLPLLLRRTAVAAAAEHRVELEFWSGDADDGGGFRQVHGGFSATAGNDDLGGEAGDLVRHETFLMQDRELQLDDWLRWSGESPTAEESVSLAAGRTALLAEDWNRVVHVLGRLNEREAARGSGCYLALPTPEQWRRAGQGADGRPWPWGFEHDLQFSRNYWSSSDPRHRLVAAASPEQDVSPFGIHDMAGSLREVCLPADALRSIGTRQFVLCGGSTFSVEPADLALTNERTTVLGDTVSDVGLRLVRAPLPALPIGPQRLMLNDLTPATLHLCAVRGPLREELPCTSRARWSDGCLLLDGYSGNFSPEVIAWQPLDVRSERVALDIEMVVVREGATDRGHVGLVFGTQVGFDSHDERLAFALSKSALQVVRRETTLTQVSFPRLVDGAVMRMSVEPTGAGARVGLACDGVEVATLPFALGDWAPARWRYFGLRLPTFVGMTLTVRSLRIEER